MAFPGFLPFIHSWASQESLPLGNGDFSFGDAAVHRKGFDSSDLGRLLNRSLIRQHNSCF